MADIFRTRVDPTLTPEQREERITELRKQRHARARWLGIRAAIGTGVLIVVLALAGWWLLSTVGGRQFLLAQIVARLPANAEFTWASAEGPVQGPLTLRDVHFSYNGIVFDAQRVTVDPALQPLLGKRLRLDALQIEGAKLDLPKSDKPFELPRWPDVLPQIAPPLAIKADDLQIDGLAVTSAGEPLISIRRLRGGLLAEPGKLHVEHLSVDSNRGLFGVDGDYAPGDNFRTDLTATAIFPAARGRTPARLGLVARGDLSDMQVGIGGAVPGRLRATLQLQGAETPTWSLRADAEALDLALLTDPATAASGQPIALQLQARGTGGNANLQGRFSQGDLVARILPSRLRIENQVLQVQPLAVEVFEGRIDLRGRADFNDPDNASFKFAVNARDLQWGGSSETPTSSAQAAADTPVISANAQLGVAGTLKHWAAIGDAKLVRDGDTAALTIDSRGDAEHVDLKALQVRMASGSLDATGALAWAPTLGWDIDATLAGFDPGYFAPDWSGAINGELHSTGQTRPDGGLEIAVQAPRLGGRLRGRPLDGSGNFAMHGASTSGGETAYEGDVDLSLGESRIKAQARIDSQLDVTATLSPLQLADLLPDAAGTLRGTVELSGTRTAPDITADLTGSALKYGQYIADGLRVQGELPWARGNGAITVDANGLAVGVPLDTVSIEARGAVEDLQLDARASGEIGTLALSGSAEHRGNAWQGTLQSLQLAPQKGAQWQLRGPAQYRVVSSPGGANTALTDFCLASSAGGSLCANADWPRRGATVRGEGLPLSLAQPYLPKRDDGGKWLLRGDIAIDAQVQPAGNGFRGHARVTSASGGLKFDQTTTTELLRYDDLDLDANFQPAGIEVTLATTLNEDGHLRGDIATGWQAYSPLSGKMSLDIDDLTWLELFSPDIVQPHGVLTANLGLAGTRDQPSIGGQAQLKNFGTEIPSLAITLREGNVRLDALPDGSAKLAGSVRSGPTTDRGQEGVLNIDGTLGWKGQDTPLVINLQGTEIVVADTPDLHVVASPDVRVRVATDKPITVTGTVAIPEADINLEKLEGGVSASSDVVVLDPVDPNDQGNTSALALDLTLVVGDDVHLTGFGLDGELTGRMKVRARPGREITALGNLDVSGEYAAYGQELEITRGRLAWSNGPVADPIFDLRAKREIQDVTAGVDISGRVSAPTIRVWSDPASSPSEALAYLTLGRSLSSLTGDERDQVSAANAALTAGGGLLASKLGAKIGLDDAGVSQSRTLGGSVLGVGKYLSPKLYVGYGVSLLGTGQVLILRYLLGRGFDIEIESSTLETRGSLNWRKEK